MKTPNPPGAGTLAPAHHKLQHYIWGYSTTLSQLLAHYLVIFFCVVDRSFGGLA
jgi:hypothetical protein